MNYPPQPAMTFDYLEPDGPNIPTPQVWNNPLRPSNKGVRMATRTLAGLGYLSASCCTLGQADRITYYTAPRWLQVTWGLLSAASVGLSAYHGYKRNDSIGWAIGWGVLGGLFPIITPAVALAQGFGQRK